MLRAVGAGRKPLANLHFSLKPMYALLLRTNSQPLSHSSNSSSSSAMSSQTNCPSFLLSMVLAALAIRLVVMVFLLPEQLEPQRDHWHFGYEAGRIARSIAQGHGFSSPLFEETGPTA